MPRSSTFHTNPSKRAFRSAPHQGAIKSVGYLPRIAASCFMRKDLLGKEVRGVNPEKLSFRKKVVFVAVMFLLMGVVSFGLSEFLKAG